VERTVRERDLLLFRAVQEPRRRKTVLAMLAASGVGDASLRSAYGDVWELYDAAGDAAEAPVAVASTSPRDDGRCIELTAIAVASSRRREGIGRRVIDDLSDALRARGAMLLVAVVADADASTARVLQRWGLRPAALDRADAAAVGGSTFVIEL
jgi:ribosomal protein S18 acetylase RimI-like enzyme